MRKLILILTTLFISFYTTAQENVKKCGTTQLVKWEKQNNPDYKNLLNNFYQGIKEWQNDKKFNTITTIPIVVHIIHRQNHSTIGSGTNISDVQVQNVLGILNEDFRKLNPEFPNPPRNTFSNFAGDSEIEFCLATTDQNGNSTSGITRTASTKTNFDCDDNADRTAMKRDLTGGKDGWNPLKYLNIWVCDLWNSQGGGQTLGFSYLPGVQSSSWNAWKDGLVVDFQHFGDTLQAGNSDGRTPTHEVGHYLGLYHTFCEDEDSQGNPICCDNDNTIFGGFVDDTPATKDIYYGSVNSSTPSTSSPDYNSCDDLNYGFNTNYPDMHENFMSYAKEPWMFTHKQINVMHYTLNQTWSNGGRLELKNSNGCLLTAIDEIINTNLITIYPNPSRGLVNFKLAINLRFKKITIQNILGKRLMSLNNIKSKQFTLDLSSFPNGIYFVTFSTSKGVSIKKIVITN